MRRRLRFSQVFLPSEGIRYPFSRRVAERQGATLQDAVDNTAAENGEGALRYGFAHGRRYDSLDCFLCFRVVGACGLGML
jgi:hypothetical protein